MWGAGIDGPDAGGVVGRAGRKVTHVWGEQHAGYVRGVGEETADGDNGCRVCTLDHTPDVDVALFPILAC